MDPWKLMLFFCLFSVAFAIEFGTVADHGDYPYLACIHHSERYVTAVLLSRTTLITSTRSIWGISSFYIILGGYNVSVFEPEQQRISLTSEAVTVHPGFDPVKLNSPDLSLIKLPTPVELTDYIQVAPFLPREAINNEESFAGRLGILAGWDSLWEGQVFFSNNILRNENCAREPTSYQMCIAGRSLAGPSEADSGAPLIAAYLGQPVLVGILSYSELEIAGRPSVYSRISAYAAWIEENSDIVFPDIKM